MPSPLSRTLGILRFSLLNVMLPLLAAWLLMKRANGDFGEALQDPYARHDAAYGAFNLKIKLSDTTAGIEEPLLTIGKPGDATFVFIRLLPERKARVGIEFWGYFSDESVVFALPADRNVLTLKISLPALYPSSRDPAWRQTTPGQQDRLLSHYVLAVDGIVRLRGKAPPKALATAPLAIGANSIGGSLVSDRFTGQIVGRWRDY